VLDFKNKGKASVRVQYIGPAPLDDNGTHLVAMNKELNRGTPLRRMIAAADTMRGRPSAPEVQVAEAKVRKPRKNIETVAYTPPVRLQQQADIGMETSFFVQLGSFSDPANAARARDQFASVWPVQFIELSGASGPVYRVRLGPISDQQDAQTALDNAFAAGYSDARLSKAQAMQAALQ
jgi:rare lipoprotein A